MCGNTPGRKFAFRPVQHGPRCRLLGRSGARVITRMQKGQWFVEDAREFPTPHILVAIKGTEAGGFGAYLKDRAKRRSERAVVEAILP